MKKIIYAILAEWRFLVLIAVLLYGIVSINGNLQELADVVSNIDTSSGAIDTNTELYGIKAELKDIALSLSSISNWLDVH